MKVAVGIPSSESARYAIFYDSLLHVEGVTHKNVIQGRSNNVAENRNGIAERALALGYDAVWYVDDDQVFGPQTLNQLLAHDKDIVSGLYLQRGAPFIPVMYSRQDENGACLPKLLMPLTRGLVPVAAVGAGCLLVKRSVFQAMEQPWWRLGQIRSDGWGDDLDFCRRAKAKGFEIYCDLSTPVGHVMTGVLWPAYDANTGQWATVMLQGGDIIATWPPAQAAP